jgi:hypothetical protein
MPQHPDADPNDVLARIRAELAQNIEIVRQIKLVLSSDPEFYGLSIVGGVKAVLKRYQEERDKNFELERELKKLIVKR